MTSVRKSRRTSGPEKEADDGREAALARASDANSRRPDQPKCASYKQGAPVFNVLGNIAGMADKQSPVTNMKMCYQSRKSGPPELQFDIDLRKEEGEDERYLLTNEPSAQEREQRVQEKLCRLEGELAGLLGRLEFVKGLRREWNAQKAALCNRRLKDKPTCCAPPFGRNQ